MFHVVMFEFSFVQSVQPHTSPACACAVTRHLPDPTYCLFMFRAVRHTPIHNQQRCNTTKKQKSASRKRDAPYAPTHTPHTARAA